MSTDAEKTVQCIEETLLAYCRQQGLFKSGDRVIAAYSGGADSMALLLFLLRNRRTLEIEVQATHVNHGIRGAAAARDANFVADFCRQNGVELFLYDAAQEGIKIPPHPSEDWARGLRYGWFDELAARQEAVIATAHTMSDQAETVLFRLARGTGLHGLAGIPPRRGCYVRPMLCLTRADTEAYCAALGQHYIQDETNAEDVYARNRIRHHAVPALESVNPAFVQHAADTAALLREDEAFLSGLAADFLAGQMPAEGIPIAELLALPRPVRVRALQQAAGRELSRRHLLALERLCDGEGLGYADVPGLRVTREQGRLFFGAQALPPLGTHILRPGETAEIPELGLRITVGVPEPFREIHSAFTTFCFKSAIIHDKLSVTPRRPGDRIRLAGRGCTKRVSDLFAERGLTQAERDRVPIIRAADAPAAIAGFGVAEQCAAAPGQTMICIRMEQIQTYGGEYYERYER